MVAITSSYRPLCIRQRKETSSFAKSVSIHVLLFLVIGYTAFNHKREQPSVKVMQVSLISVAAPENISTANAKPTPVKSKPALNTKTTYKAEKHASLVSVRPKVNKPVIQSLESLEPAAGEKTGSREIFLTQTISRPAIVSSLSGTGEHGKEHSTVIPVVSDVRYRYQSPPEYPSRAREMGEEGKVVLQALIDPNGSTKDVKIVRSSGFNLLDMAAYNAVRQWEFEPARQAGRTIISWVEVPVQFIIR